MINKKIFVNFWEFVKKNPFTILGIPFFFNCLFRLFFCKTGFGTILEGLFNRGVSIRKVSIIFMVFCVSIGRCVLLFRVYYIPPSELNSFSFILFQFIIFIIYLTRGINMLRMFLGWEGVGLISFLLIGWFSSREEAISGAKKAVLFNRFTDFFFFFLILIERGELIWFFSNEIRRGREKNYLNSNYFVFFGFFFSASFFFRTAGKSAQFVFHPWLTAAIEGPTPVRSLLHRRTIVVAGVYLLFFLSPYLESGNYYLTLKLIFFSSLFTLIRSSLWALFQTDIKKIVALSTTSQLSFIICLICFGFPDLAFLHLILHGYFKALVFIGRGVGIHSRSSSTQDVRKIGASSRNKYLIVFFFVGNLGLIGMPFFGSFNSKHQFLSLFKENDSILIRMLQTSIFRGFFLFVSSSLTVSYSIKSLVIFWRESPSMLIKAKSPNLREWIPTFFLSIIRILCGLIFFNVLKLRSFQLNTFFQKWDLLFILVLGVFVLISSKSLKKENKNYFFNSFFRIYILKGISFFIKNNLKLLFNLNLEIKTIKKRIKEIFLFLLVFPNKSQRNLIKHRNSVLNKGFSTSLNFSFLLKIIFVFFCCFFLLF